VSDDDDDNNDNEGSSDNEYKFAFRQQDVICSIQDEAAIPKGWILLDSQSTVDMFSN